VLLGREQECARIERLLEDARSGRSRTLVIRGEAGIGKTALLSHAVGRAGGMLVLRSRGVESEAELAFSGLLELSRPVLDRLDQLPDRQADALRTAFALTPARAVDRFTISAATMSLIATTAEETPILVAVDDAHWLDSASIDALLFAARRLDADRVALLFSVREGEGRFPSEALDELTLDGLSPDAAAELLFSSAASDVAPEVAEQLFALTQGNPLALVELPQTLSPAQLAGAEALKKPLQLGRNVERAFARRAAALGERQRQALLVAAASDSDQLQPIASALPSLGLDLEALQVAEDADLVRLEGDRIVFRHPLVRSAVYQSAAPSERRAAHAALAEAFVAGGGGDERRAWHLAAAAVGPDEDVAAALESAATGARERSGYGAAAAAYERSARLTPSLHGRLRRLYRAADAAWLAGRTKDALRLLEDALGACDEPHLRGQLLALSGHIEHLTGSQTIGHELLVEAASLLEPRARTEAVAALEDAYECCLYLLDIEPALDVARRLHALARRDNGAEEFLASLALGSALCAAQRAEEGIPLLEHALDLEDVHELLQKAPRHLTLAGAPAWWLDQPERGRQLSAEVVELARERAAVGILPSGLHSVACFALAQGRWAAAYAAGSESAALARELGQLVQLHQSLWRLAWIDAAQGSEQACRAHAREAAELNETLGIAWHRVIEPRTFGLLELGLGHFEDAIGQLQHYLEVVEALTRWTTADDFALADLVEAYVRSSRLPEAERTLGSLEHFAELTPRPWLLALAARCRGLLLGEDEFEPHFNDALARHEEAADIFEQARTRLCFGERLRRAGRRKDAREQLRAALHHFEELGAAPWAQRTRAELRATGATLGRRDPTAAERLTPQELQIALQVAEGKTNREVATALFLSPKTIEFHLSRVYRKLGLRSRAELIRRFAGELGHDIRVSAGSSPDVSARSTAKGA
jgi:DNA-binding CsgD family transcriptional regulator